MFFRSTSPSLIIFTTFKIWLVFCKDDVQCTLQSRSFKTLGAFQLSDYSACLPPLQKIGIKLMPYSLIFNSFTFLGLVFRDSLQQAHLLLIWCLCNTHSCRIGNTKSAKNKIKNKNLEEKKYMKSDILHRVDKADFRHPSKILQLILISEKY